MNGIPLVTIVVPIYNVDAYLDRCIESVAGQDYDDLEIILVDDGSTDRSGTICDEWSVRDSRIKVVHKGNGGLSSARNAGIDASTGHWIRFVDADDVLPADAVSSMLGFASECDDIVCGSYLYFKDNVPSVDGCSDVVRIMDWREALEDMLYQKVISASACDKMFRRGLFDNLRFKDGILYEDLEFMSRALPMCRSIAVSRKVVYFYRKGRTGSILSVFNRKRLDVLAVTKKIHERMVRSGSPRLAKAASDRELSANFNMFLLLNRYGLGEGEAASNCWATVKRLRLASLLNPKVRLKNRLGALLSYGGRSLFALVGRTVGMC